MGDWFPVSQIQETVWGQLPAHPGLCTCQTAEWVPVVPAWQEMAADKA